MLVQRRGTTFLVDQDLMTVLLSVSSLVDKAINCFYFHGGAG